MDSIAAMVLMYDSDWVSCWSCLRVRPWDWQMRMGVIAGLSRSSRRCSVRVGIGGRPPPSAALTPPPEARGRRVVDSVDWLCVCMIALSDQDLVGVDAGATNCTAGFWAAQGGRGEGLDFAHGGRCRKSKTRHSSRRGHHTLYINNEFGVMGISRKNSLIPSFSHERCVDDHLDVILPELPDSVTEYLLLIQVIFLR